MPTNEKVSMFTPRETVSELDKYIIGQNDAKKCVAIALRNRWRRLQVNEELREDITPKNIIMIGPTGVGKTEIARRLAKLANAPFIKVEASKFTEVGYVGKDVESMIRELTELAVKMMKEDEQGRVQIKAQELAEEKLLDMLMSVGKRKNAPNPLESLMGQLTQVVNPQSQASSNVETDDAEELSETVTPDKKIQREKLRELLRDGKLDDRSVEVEMSMQGFPMIEIIAPGGPMGPAGLEEMGQNLKDMFSGLMPKQKKKKKVKVPEALKVLVQEETARLLDMENIIKRAIVLVEQNGIVFLDEIDKIAGRESHGPDVSREGVQRDILPIVEGSSVSTKYGIVKTDHILFIAAGAFHVSKPSDLIPELQGRFPLRVELHSLTKDDFHKILVEPKTSLIKQYIELMKTEGVDLVFTDDSIDEFANYAATVNERTENIGARRLHTILEKVIEDISYKAPEMRGQKVVIDAKYVKEKLENFVKNVDLSRYIL